MKRPSGRAWVGVSSDRYDVLEALFLQAYPLARRTAQVRSALSRGTDIEREDLEQETLIAIWVALGQFDGTRASLRTFVEKVAASTITSIFRRTRALKRTRPVDCGDLQTNKLLVHVEFRVDIRRVLDKLTPLDRHVARFLAEYGPTQIARKLKISRQAVYRSTTRLRAAFREAGFE